MLMKKQFQSKAVPRGTRTIWRYLGALFILFTFAIGNVWAADTYYIVCNKAKLPLTSGMSGATAQLLKLDGTTLSATTDITITTSGSVSEKLYYNTTTATYSALTTTSNYSTGSSSNRTMSGYCLAGAGGELTIKLGSTSYSKLDVIYACNSNDKKTISIAGTAYETKDKNIHLTSITSGVTGDIVIGNSSGKDYYVFAILTKSTGGGGDPVDPEFTYTPATYVIGDPALDLSTKLSSTNTTGAITFAIKDAAGTGASIANSKNFTATTAGTAKVTVSQEASTGYNAKSQDIDVTVAAPDPCTTHFYFYNEADQTSNGKTNSAIFTNTSTGSSNMNGSITIDGTTYNTTKRSGDPSSFANFDIPANKAGTFYTLAVSSGSSARKIVITNTATSATYEYDVPGGSSAYTTVTIPNLPTGSYSVGKSGGNTRLGMMALKVCDAEYHTITLDLDGGTGATSIQVLDGVPATKPADPTKAHCAFAGWVVKSTSAAYDWAANVTGDLTLKATWTQLYTVTFANGGGSGDAPAAVADKAQGETFAVPANTFTAPEGKEFDKWNDGSADYAPGDTYTVGTDNVVLTAVWKQLVAKYTVVFKDGETTLDTKLFDVGTNPSDAGVDKTKPLYTFAAWQKDASDIALDDASWTSVAKDAEITLTARWAVAYASDVNFKDEETQALGVATVLNTYHYASDASDISFESKGLKIKTDAARFYFNVAPGKVAEIKFGNISGATYSVDGGAAETLTSSQLKATYSASAQSCVMTMTTAAYNIVEKVTIHDPYQVSYDPHGADAIAAQYGTPSVTLPTPVNGTGVFKGWYDAETEGNKIGNAGATYTPTASITLHAQWETVSSDNTLSDLQVDGATVDGFDPAVNIYYLGAYEYGQQPFITSATPTAEALGATVAISNTPVHYQDATEDFWYVQANVTPASGTPIGYNQVRYNNLPKRGVALIEANLTSKTAANYDGLYPDKTNSKINMGDPESGYTGYKFNGSGKYIKLQLKDATYSEGDILWLTISGAATQGALKLYTEANNEESAIATTDFASTYIVLPAAAEGLSTIYVSRTSGNNYNAHITAAKVTRYMASFIAEFKIGDAVGTIDQDHKTIAVEVPWDADLQHLTPTVKAWANGGATVSPTGEQDFTSAQTYTVNSAYTAEDAPVDYTVNVTKGDHYVAQIGSNQYTSLEAALAHAADGEIVLIDDIDVTAQIEIADGVTAVIDLAGHKIEYTGTSTLPSGVILVHNGGSLTINDSSDPDAGSVVAGTKAYAALMMTKAGDDASKVANLVINGGIFTGNYYAISGNGSRPNTSITINGGTFTATATNDNLAIYHPQNGTLTINGGLFTGYLSAIEMRAGTLVINDGSFTATATEFICNPNGGGTTTQGAAIAIAQHTTKKDISVTINGGTFNGVKALNESNPQANDPAPQVTMAVKGGDFVGEVSTVDVNHFVSGGTFKYEVAEAQCANGYMPSPQDPGTGKYGVLPKDPMCLIKADITGANTAEVVVGYGETTAAGGINGAVELEVDAVTYTGYKFNNEGAYLEIQLASGNFLEGDSVEIMITKAQSKPIKIYGAESATAPIYTAPANMTAGKNYAILPAGVNTNKLYLRRLSDSWNPNVAYVAVFRSANPILQEFELAGEAGVINEAAKTVAVEVPYGTDVTALTPTLHYLSNGDALVDPVTPTGAQDFTSPVVYTITDKDGSATAYTVTVTIAEPSADATLSALSYGDPATAIALEDGVYDYVVNLAKGTTDVPALTAVATKPALVQSVVIDDADEFVSYEATSTVVVTAQDGTTTKTYTVLFKVAHTVATLVDVTENTTWDWSLVTKDANNADITSSGVNVNESEAGLILASYLMGDNFDKIEGNNGAYAIRNGSDKKVYQGANLHFHSTVGGYLSIWAANEGHSMTLNVANEGRDIELATLTGSQVEYKVYVKAGDVVIYNVPASGTSPMRVSKIVFTVKETPDYTRDQMLGNGVYGTICLPNNVPAGAAFGATFYELVGREPQYGKLAFDEIVSGELEAGKPYVFQAHGDALEIFYGDTHVDDPVDPQNGMYGTFEYTELTELDDVYYFAQRALWSCDDLTVLKIPANRAYVKLSEIDYLTDPNPAPGRIRMMMNVNGAPSVITGCENLDASETPVKVMIDGQMFILRGEKMYDATGRLVK